MASDPGTQNPAFLSWYAEAMQFLLQEWTSAMGMQGGENKQEGVRQYPIGFRTFRASNVRNLDKAGRKAQGARPENPYSEPRADKGNDGIFCKNARHGRVRKRIKATNPEEKARHEGGKEERRQRRQAEQKKRDQK